MEQGNSILNDLLAPAPTKFNSDCGLTKIKKKLDEESAKAIDRAVEMIRDELGTGKSRVYSSQWLTGILRKHGYDISTSTVVRHVAKRCRCE